MSPQEHATLGILHEPTPSRRWESCPCEGMGRRKVGCSLLELSCAQLCQLGCWVVRGRVKEERGPLKSGHGKCRKESCDGEWEHGLAGTLSAGFSLPPACRCWPSLPALVERGFCLKDDNCFPFSGVMLNVLGQTWSFRQFRKTNLSLTKERMPKSLSSKAWISAVRKNTQIKTKMNFQDERVFISRNRKHFCGFGSQIFFIVCMRVLKYAFSVKFSLHNTGISCFADR